MVGREESPLESKPISKIKRTRKHSPGEARGGEEGGREHNVRGLRAKVEQGECRGGGGLRDEGG